MKVENEQDFLTYWDATTELFDNAFLYINGERFDINKHELTFPLYLTYYEACDGLFAAIIL